MWKGFGSAWRRLGLVEKAFLIVLAVWLLLREIVFGQDGSFSFDALVQPFNADLANDLGNLSSRTLSMITRFFDGEVPYPSPSQSTPADEAVRSEDRRL